MVKKRVKIPLLKFSKEPEFAELWDACLYKFLYDQKKHVSEVRDIFKEIGFTKKMDGLDTSAGTGFIALHLRKLGYKFDCMDLMEDEIRVFKRKAKKMNVSPAIKKLSWKQMPQNYKKESYDFLFCRGNSFIYADGGWNKSQKVSKESSLKSYEKTLKIFYDTLKDGGYLYLDKFRDSEKPHKTLVANMKVGNNQIEKLYFYNKKIPSKRYREAAMIRETVDGKESGLPNMTFDLRESEVERLLKKVGFSKVKKLQLKTEGHFVVWLAKK